MTKDKLLTPPQVAQHLQVNERTVTQRLRSRRNSWARAIQHSTSDPCAAQAILHRDTDSLDNT